MVSREVHLGDVHLSDQAKENVAKCLEAGRLTSGPFVEQFEEKIAEVAQARYAVAVSSGTAADFVLMLALRQLEPSKEEVLMPALTFVAHAAAVVAAGLRPAIVDVDADAQMVAWSEIPVQVLCQFPAYLLGVVRKEYRDDMVVDACQAFGAPLTCWAQTHSFYVSHTLTCGEGGAIVTDDSVLAALCRAIRNHGRTRAGNAGAFRFGILGWNARMSELHAAIGCAEIERLLGAAARRRDIVQQYNEILGRDWHVDWPHGYLFVARDEAGRHSLLCELERCGVEARPLFGCLPYMGAMRNVRHRVVEEARKAKSLAAAGLYLPVHEWMSDEDVERVAGIVWPYV